MPRKPKREGGPTPQAPQHAMVQPAQSPNIPTASVPTGLPQGEHKALVDSAAAVPMPNMDARIQQAIAAVNNRPQGMLGGGALLSAPTDSPSEPVQAGLPIGPGPGPEAVAPPAPPVQIEDANMAKYLPMLETLADQPNVSNATRNYVRLLRGQLPPQITMQSIVKPPEASSGVH